MNRRNVTYTLIALLCATALLLVGFQDKKTSPKEVYRVYLAGKSIGLIESKQELEKYIDQEQEYLKQKYNVNKVYAPKNLDVEKEITYDEKISSTEEIYNKIKDITPFTLNGYKYVIKGVKETLESGEEVTTKDEIIYVLDKNIFDEAVDKTIRSFIPSEEYDKYINEEQVEIKDTGKIIEKVEIKNKITYQKDNIPADQMIYTTVEDLSKYLLFGTLEEQTKYTVQAGDTIEDVSFNNKISTEEFLVANPEFKDADSLLFSGQEVTLGILKPKFKTIEEDHIVELQETKYTTEVRYDNNLMIGTTNVLQEGQNGLNRVTTKVQKENGAILTSVITNKEELKPAVNEIIVKGGKSSYYTDAGYWIWPTITPYIISSPFGYRWGSFHDGMDISGVGYGSPVKAVNNGEVVEVGNRWPNGIYAIIDHKNGYFTIYAHLSARYVSKGQMVEIGQVIGAVGNTGWVTGTHLHLGLFRGYPYRGGTALNPMGLYR